MGIELRYMIFYAKPSPVTNPLVYSIDVLNYTKLQQSMTLSQAPCHKMCKPNNL